MSELKISPELLQISPEVQDALKNKKPVVALESTIISHGMPFPQNAETAIEVEDTIRKHGAVPATIAIIGGVMKVGLSKEEIELLGREGHNVTKVSRRDLPFVVATGKNGATTVASTMIIAALAGIKVFATGVLVVYIAVRNIHSIFLPIYRNWQILMSPLFVPVQNLFSI
ncbi:hypothetical protein EsCd1HHP049_02637 [Escherichia sp. HH154_1D]|nr:hypothetical protein EsCd1HHP049_02637 [Escherichia sp. HH154_1D]